METSKMETDKMTTRDVAHAIWANGDRYHARLIGYEEFNAEQRRLWDYAEKRSRRFFDLVTDRISGRI